MSFTINHGESAEGDGSTPAPSKSIDFNGLVQGGLSEQMGILSNINWFVQFGSTIGSVIRISTSEPMIYFGQFRYYNYVSSSWTNNISINGVQNGVLFLDIGSTYTSKHLATQGNIICMTHKNNKMFQIGWTTTNYNKYLQFSITYLGD